MSAYFSYMWDFKNVRYCLYSIRFQFFLKLNNQ